MKSIFALICLSLCLATPLIHAEDAPAAEGGLAGIDLLQSGDFEGQVTVRYTPEEVENFLQQFVGVWEGKYVISAMTGQVLKELQTRVEYQWELVGETRVLKGRSVYFSGERMSHSTSQSYFWEGRLVSEVEEDGAKRIFLGRIADTGDSVNWDVANTGDPLKTATRETFSVREDGQRQITVSGYEELHSETRATYIQLRGDLVQTAATPEATK